MKKLIVLSVLFASTVLPHNQISAQSDESTTDTERKSGYIFTSGGCFYSVVTHSMLWGLITWEENPVLLGCGEGGLWGEGHP